MVQSEQRQSSTIIDLEMAFLTFSRFNQAKNAMSKILIMDVEMKQLIRNFQGTPNGRAIERFRSRHRPEDAPNVFS